MKKFNKLTLVLVALTVNYPCVVLAKANPDHPYCEHDSECATPIMDGTWNGPCCIIKPEGSAINGQPCKECDDVGRDKVQPPNPNPKWPCWRYNDSICEWYELDPGPKPEGCYLVNRDCKWQRFVPDCKTYQDIVDKIEINIARIVLIALPAARQKEHRASIWCDCDNGSITACAIAESEKHQYPKPNSPCTERDIQRGIINIYLSQLDLAEKEHKIAKEMLV